MSKKTTLSMEEAKKRASESFGGTEVEGTYELNEELWPFVYRIPTTGMAGKATKKSVIRNPDGSVSQDHFGFMVELMLSSLVDAPFEISKESIEKLNPLIFGQIADQLTEYLSAGQVPKKS